MPGKTRHGKTPYKFIGKARSYYTRYQSVKGLKLMPCRQCLGCRLENSRQWATRLMLEKNAHDKACFLTLTYDEEHLPKNRSLIPTDLTTFFKDLRARMDYYGKEKIKFFAVGEYGTAGERALNPHYHAILFGPLSGDLRNDLPGSGYVRQEPSRSGAPQWSHPDIGAVWSFGRHRISELSFESAAYVARYCLKKIPGASAADYYRALQPDVFGDLVPEFQRGSNGLGRSHLLRGKAASLEGLQEVWLSDVYPADHIVLPGRGAFIPPPYFDRLLEKADPSLFALVKSARKAEQEKTQITTALDFQEHVSERCREGEVRKLVTDATLIRGYL